MNPRAQGAIEYLLLLAAAVVVVSVVISFMISTMGPPLDAGGQQTYDYTCKTINTNSVICGCYACDATRGGYSKELSKNLLANRADCHTLSVLKNDSLLDSVKCPGSFT
ncbi:Class III signal peptide [uncultured archaeon]|nr:Class III signal peptide [uncultured archaeon]